MKAQRVSQFTGLADAPGPELGTPFTYEESRRSMGDPAQSPDRRTTATPGSHPSPESLAKESRRRRARRHRQARR